MWPFMPIRSIYHFKWSSIQWQQEKKHIKNVRFNVLNCTDFEFLTPYSNSFCCCLSKLIIKCDGVTVLCKFARNGMRLQKWWDYKNVNDIQPGWKLFWLANRLISDTPGYFAWLRAISLYKAINFNHLLVTVEFVQFSVNFGAIWMWLSDIQPC